MVLPAARPGVMIFAQAVSGEKLGKPQPLQTLAAAVEIAPLKSPA